MGFTLELPSDVAAKIGQSTIYLDADTYTEGIWKLVAQYPSARGLLVNSQGDIRQTIMCHVDNQILNRNTPVPNDATVTLFFIPVGG